MNSSKLGPDGGWDCHVHVFDSGAPILAGHYRPLHRPLQAIEDLAARHGIGHLVLVQPSVYGCDNSVMLSALRAGRGRHRGVAVVDAAVSDAALDELHGAGVRGIRFNLVSPAGRMANPEADLQLLAPRLKARGWHVQWYVPASLLPFVARCQARTRLPFVLDHLGGLGVAEAGSAEAWAAAQALAEGGAWVKLSGWYRLGDAAPYARLRPSIQRAAALFGRRLVWGSDWPHTSFPADGLPDYESTRAPVREALGIASATSVCDEHARVLYDGGCLPG